MQVLIDIFYFKNVFAPLLIGIVSIDVALKIVKYK